MTTASPASARTSNTPAWYALSADETAQRLGVDPATGLTAAEAASRLAKDGPNELSAEKPTPGWKRFIGEYASYMQIILLGAGLVSFVIGEFSTGAVLLILTLLNAVIGLKQKGKAESAMNALKSMLKASARVRRDGSEATIPADQVVPGDVVLIAAGDQVAADGRIVSASSLQIDESSLTGESVPASKSAQTLSGSDLGPGDQSNIAFMNTPVTHGSGVIIVTQTGATSEVGKISKMLTETKVQQTPLDRQINTMTLWIAAAAGVTMLVMFATGLARGESWNVLFISAVALAIASIPEALPTVVDVILSTGAVALAKAHAIVKDLGSVETLGSTSAINSDKTGTLTMNQMTVVEVLDPTDRYTVSGAGYSLEGQVHHAAGNDASIDDAILPFLLANDAELQDGKVVGDPTEGALLVLAHKAGLSIDATREAHPRLATLPFDPTYKLMAAFSTVTDQTGKPQVRAYVKGAAPAVLGRSTTALSGGQVVPLDDTLKAASDAQQQRLGGEGLRVMAAAYTDIEPEMFSPDGDLLAHLTDLTVTSMVGMVDPPRPDSKESVQRAQQAHIQVRMVTGDDVVTGAAIAKQLGIPGEAILGADFAALSEPERLDRIDGIGVVGRVAPEHKVLIVETLKKKGDVVAMTGDGVNDAPAIKAADIGIAMGTGTQVAKNAGRMILTDDAYSTIVLAVEQGRKLYDNLDKFIRFVLITLVVFVMTFLGASILNIAAGQPFTPVQILWINFVIDAVLGTALGFDKETPGLMKLRPRSRDEGILTRSVLTTVGLVGLFMAASLLLLINYGATHLGSVMLGSTLALTAFTMFRVVGSYQSRSETQSCLSVSTFDNGALNAVVLGELALAWLVTEWDVLRSLLGTQELSGSQWLLAVAPAVVLFGLWEVGKWIARRSRGRTDDQQEPGAVPLAPI
ncbi:MAG: HAD-IC family P-type ATPase [Candidatus Nanopelagicales bacterium]